MSARPETDSQWRALSAEIPVGLAIFDTDLRFVEINAEMERINARPAADHIGRVVIEVFPGVEGDLIAGWLREVLETGARIDTPRLRGRNAVTGQDLTTMASYFPVLDDTGEVVGVACAAVDITAHADVEDRLRETSTRMETLLRLAPMGVVDLDRDLCILRANRAFATSVGQAADDCVGRPLAEVSPTVHDQIGDVLRRVIETGATVTDAEVSGPVRGRDASQVRHARVACYQLANEVEVLGVGMILWDVTDSRKAERRRQSFIDALFTFVGLLDPDGVVLEANRTALDAAGITSADVVGRPFWEAYWWSHDPDVQAELQQAVRRAQDGVTSRYDAVVRVAHDRLITIDFQLVPLFEDHVLIGMVVSGLDITDRIEHRDQLAALANLGRALSAAVTTDDLARIVVDPRYRPAVGTEFVNLGLLDPDGRHLTMIQPETLEDEIAERYQRVPLDAPVTICGAVRERRLVAINGPDDEGGRYAPSWPDVEAAGLAAVAAIPLLRNDGSVIGVVGFGWSTPIDLEDVALRARAETMAELCAQTLERTRTVDVRNELVLAMQHELLPGVPEVRDLDIAVRYLAATAELGFGGDWYEVIALDEHRTAVVVGDIAGHGVRAAARIAQIRGLISSLLLIEVADEPDVLTHLFARAARILTQEGLQFLGTAAVLVIDARERTIRWVSAGHPPLLLRRASGVVEELEDGRVAALGLPASAVAVPSTSFDVGDTIVLYTDGLVERPGEDFDTGAARLAGLLAEDSGARPEGFADAALAQLLPGPDRRDDVAMVVVRRSG